MDVKEIGKMLKANREAYGITRNRMAKKTKLHPETIINIEEGFTGYNIFALMTYCRVFGMDITLTYNTEPQNGKYSQ